MSSLDGKSTETILVVEDESAIVKLCRRTLSDNGFEVDNATNGKIAQEMVKKKDYFLFLIDIRTPVMNGIEFFRWLREIHPEMTDRVIFMTGDMVRGETTRFVEKSGRPFLLKPFTPDELQAIISDTLDNVEVYERQESIPIWPLKVIQIQH